MSSTFFQYLSHAVHRRPHAHGVKFYAHGTEQRFMLGDRRDVELLALVVGSSWSHVTCHLDYTAFCGHFRRAHVRLVGRVHARREQPNTRNMCLVVCNALSLL